jgi:hypothetical protein
LGRGLDAVIPSGPREVRPPLPPYEDPVVGRLDDLVDEVRKLGDRVDDLIRVTAGQARRRLWSVPRCGRLGRLVTTARAAVTQLAGIGTAMALDVTDLALGTARELLDAAQGRTAAPRDHDA